MRYWRIIFVILLFMAVNLQEVFAQGPPFKNLVIEGKADEKYTYTSLFLSGKDVRPYKTSNVNSGWYSLQIKIPQDMQDKGTYYIADMRFWGDSNNNGKVDTGEPKSQCHFIIWEIRSNKITMQIYKGPELEITKSTFEYNYE